MGQRILKLAFAIAFGVILAGCSNPKSTVIPPDMGKWDTELKPALEKLSEEDRKLFAQYMLRAKLGEVFGQGGVPTGTTVGDAIENQKSFAAEQEKKAAEAKALKEKLEREQAIIAKKIDEAVTVSVLKIGVVNADSYGFSQKIVMHVATENKSNRRIAAIKGRIDFYDSFDQKVGDLKIKDESDIEPGATKKSSWNKNFNQFLAEDKAFATLQEGKYKAVFVGEALVFSDGEKLVSPSAE